MSGRLGGRTLLGGIVKGSCMTDLELLREYSHSRSQTAFAESVEKYVRLVHWACWRQLGDTQLAEDATQMVFVLLSQRAGRMRHGEVAGWLLTTAHFTCANMKRSEQRRQRREQEVAVKENSGRGAGNVEMLAVLDEGMMRLRDVDRVAVVLRFFQERPLRQVGESLGMSEDAARSGGARGGEAAAIFPGAGNTGGFGCAGGDAGGSEPGSGDWGIADTADCGGSGEARAGGDVGEAEGSSGWDSCGVGDSWGSGVGIF